MTNIDHVHTTAHPNTMYTPACDHQHLEKVVITQQYAIKIGMRRKLDSSSSLPREVVTTHAFRRHLLSIHRLRGSVRNYRRQESRGEGEEVKYPMNGSIKSNIYVRERKRLQYIIALIKK